MKKNPISNVAVRNKLGRLSQVLGTIAKENIPSVGFGWVSFEDQLFGPNPIPLTQARQHGNILTDTRTHFETWETNKSSYGYDFAEFDNIPRYRLFYDIPTHIFELYIDPKLADNPEVVGKIKQRFHLDDPRWVLEVNKDQNLTPHYVTQASKAVEAFLSQRLSKQPMPSPKKAIPVSRALQHINGPRPCAFISAYLFKDPDTQKVISEAENKKAQSSLKKEVQAEGLGYVEIISQYQEEGQISSEESLLIPECSLEKAVELGVKFRQDSVLAKDKNNQLCLVDTRRNPGSIREKFTNINFSEQDFKGAFSKLKHGGPSQRTKRLQFSYLAEMTILKIWPIASLKSRLHPDYVYIDDGIKRPHGNFFME